MHSSPILANQVLYFVKSNLKQKNKSEIQINIGEWSLVDDHSQVPNEHVKSTCTLDTLCACNHIYFFYLIKTLI